jgi:hypothetical protein
VFATTPTAKANKETEYAGFTPLMLAITVGDKNLACVKTLVLSGANIDNYTTCSLAREHPEISKFFKEHMKLEDP